MTGALFIGIRPAEAGPAATAAAAWPQPSPAPYRSLVLSITKKKEREKGAICMTPHSLCMLMMLLFAAPVIPPSFLFFAADRDTLRE